MTPVIAATISRPRISPVVSHSQLIGILAFWRIVAPLVYRHAPQVGVGWRDHAATPSSAGTLAVNCPISPWSRCHTWASMLRRCP